MRFSLRHSCAIAMLTLTCGAALATPAMEMQPDVLLPMASELRKSLNLTPNQQTLWQQVEGRSKAILRERQGRRERLQQALKTGLEGPQVELRELWLGVNDALDENQRRQVATLLAEQLMRVAEGEQRHAPARGAEDGKGQHRGMGRGK